MTINSCTPSVQLNLLPSPLACYAIACAFAIQSGAHAAESANGESPGVAYALTVGDAARGARLINQYQCGACHTIPGVAAARGKEGPPLRAFGQRSYIAGRVPNTLASLTRWIERPSALVPTTTMPDMGVPSQDARDMAAWLWQQQD